MQICQRSRHGAYVYGSGRCRAAASVVCVHPQLPEDVCRMLGIPPLQEVVSEMADGKQPPVYLDALDVSLCSQREFEH